MLSKNWFVVLAVLATAAFEANHASAAGHGVVVSRPHGGAATGFRIRSDNSRENSRQFFGAENGIFGPYGAYGNGYWGWGGAGYGWGLGYGYPGWGFELVGVPYFSQFPPVYYGYTDNMPVVKTPMPPSVGPAAFASPPRPLRIMNPYYAETKVDKPVAENTSGQIRENR